MVRLCAATLGLLAFAVSIILGLVTGNPTGVTLVRALWAMLIFCMIGLCVGWAAYRILDEHTVRRHREMFGDEKKGPEEQERGSEDQGDERTAAGSAPGAGQVPGARGAAGR